MKRLLGLIVLLLCLLVPAVALAADPPPAPPDPLVPARASGAAAYGKFTPLYDDDRFPIWNYTFEGDSFDQPGYNTIYFTINGLLVGKAWLLKTALRTSEYALTQNFFDPLAQKAGNALTAVGNYLWNMNGAPLVAGALTLAGMWAVWLYLRGRTSRVWGTIGGSLLIVVISAVILAAGADSVKSMVGISRDLAIQVYSGVERTSGYVDTGLVAKAGDATWRQLVYQPWVDGALGSKEGAERFRYPGDTLDAARFLNMTQDYRRRYVPECQSFAASQQATYCPWWNVQFLPRRFMLSLTTFMDAVLYGGAIFALSGGILLAQMTLLLFVALLPVWLLVALWWPSGGVRLTGRILSVGLGALVSQVVLAATLSVLLVLSIGASEAFASTGWMLQGLVFAALGFLAYKYRFAWLSALQSRSRREGESDPGVLEHLRGWFGRAARPAVAGAAPALQAVPVFSAMQNVAPADMAPVERTTVVEHDRSGAEHLAPRDIFFSEMRTLREQMTLRTEVLRDGERITPQTGPGKKPGWEEPAPSVEGRASNAVAERARKNDMLNLPAERPKS